MKWTERLAERIVTLAAWAFCLWFAGVKAGSFEGIVLFLLIDINFDVTWFRVEARKRVAA